MRKILLTGSIYLSAILYIYGQSGAKHFPAGILLEENAASAAIKYHFCNDGRILKDHDYFDIKSYGHWTLKKDTLTLSFFKIDGLRGIGQAKSNQAGGNLSHYDETVYFVEHINTKERFAWNEMQKSIEKGVVYKVIQTDIDCSKLNFDVELPGDYPFASSKKLTKNELTKFSKEELRKIRNEIFARYGYRFTSKELKLHFEGKAWYKPKLENVDRYLTAIEKENIETIKKLENKLSQ